MRAWPSFVLAAACGTSSASPPDAGPASGVLFDHDAAPEASAVVYPAPHPAPPREKNAGGPVLARPRIVPITYDVDPYRAKIEDFVAKIGTSAFWSAVTSEYGVGPATMGRPVHLAEAAPAAIDDVDLKAWLAGKLDGTHAEFDPPDDETMYVVFFPQGTTYTLFGWTGCREFGASDNVLTLPSGRAVPYVAMPRCPPLDGLDVWNTISAMTSHELYEQATDPFKSAVVTVDDDHMAWSLTPPFSEIGDMCLADPTEFVVPPDLGSAVQRGWSNAAAAAGKNPCVPAPDGAVYFNAAPVLTDDVTISEPPADAGPPPWSGTTKGVKIAVGETRTIEVDLFSEAAVPAWRVRAFNLASDATGAPDLELTLDRDHGQNGDKLALTIHVVHAGAGGGSRFLLVSDDTRHAAFWFGYVGN